MELLVQMKQYKEMGNGMRLGMDGAVGLDRAESGIVTFWPGGLGLMDL